jgi:hypothetical protein
MAAGRASMSEAERSASDGGPSSEAVEDWPWVHEVASEMSLPQPRSDAELTKLLEMAIERRLITAPMLRRAPRLDEDTDLDVVLTTVFGTEYRAPPSDHVGRTRLKDGARLSDVHELLNLHGGLGGGEGSGGEGGGGEGGEGSENSSPSAGPSFGSVEL